MGAALADRGWRASSAMEQKPNGRPAPQLCGPIPPVACREMPVSHALVLHVSWLLSRRRGLLACMPCPQRYPPPLLASSPVPCVKSASTCSLHPQTATVRLVDGDIASNPRAAQGRLEVQLPNGKWSTVCDDDFSDASATVVCRQARQHVLVCSQCDA